ncbi:hypothetical protein ATCC90586_000038 [Pythium insidiosum]|nr:hypothetical protein ATCC90586_000038 [Pythium insidiosum]
MHAVAPKPPSGPSLAHASGGPKHHPFLWLTVTAIHTLCILFATYVGLVYIRLPIDAETLMTSIELYAVAVPTKYFKTVAAAYLTLGSVHALILLRILYISVRSRRLLLAEPKAGISTGLHAKVYDQLSRSVRGLTKRVLTSRTASMGPRIDSKLRTISSGAMSTARALASASNVTDKNYGKQHAIRELVETAFLTAQAYKSSYRVASPWINTVQIVLLVLNCWCFPLAERVLHTSIGWTRMLCLYINLCIDLTIYIFIPTFLFLPYERDYNPEIGEFGIVFWYTDRWLARMLNEFPMLFVTSFWDGVSKIIIGASITRTLLDIPILLQFIDSGHDRRPAESKAAAASPDKAQVAKAQPPRPSRIERGCRGILLAWGVVVLGLHIQASTYGSNPRCLEQVRPWLARHAACSLAEINCAHKGLTGRESEFNAALNNIDRQWLTYLIIRHCPAVEVTPIFQDLTSMVGFKTYNSTIARWGADAAVTAEHHARIMFVFLAATNMSVFPRGLYDPAFPPQLADIELCRSNLSTLPDAVADVWPQAIFLLLEEVAFPEVPPVLARLRPYFLSISVNTFTTIPPFLLQNPMLMFLKMNGNPASALPELPTNGSSIIPPLMWLYVAKTNVSDAPSWLDLDAMVTFDATDSPLCTRLLALDDADAMDPRTAALKQRVRCLARADSDELYHFPIELESVINA